MADSLADQIRAKFPGSYDKVDDPTLEKMWTDKYPGAYDHLVADKPQPTSISAVISNKDVTEETKPVQSGDEGKIQNLGPVTEKTAALDIAPQTKPEDEPLLSKIWRQQTTPLTDLPERASKSVSDTITEPKLDESPLVAKLKGFAGGSLEGLGKVISSLTTPLNLETMGASGLSGAADKAGLDAIAKALSLTSRGLSVPLVGEGAKQAVTGETLPDKLSGLLEAIGGIAGLRGHIPGASE